MICTWIMCLVENLFITDALYKEYQDVLKSFISFPFDMIAQLIISILNM